MNTFGYLYDLSNFMTSTCDLSLFMHIKLFSNILFFDYLNLNDRSTFVACIDDLKSSRFLHSL